MVARSPCPTRRSFTARLPPVLVNGVSAWFGTVTSADASASSWTVTFSDGEARKYTAWATVLRHVNAGESRAAATTTAWPSSRTQLVRLGLRRVATRGQGDCLYDSVGWSLTGEPAPAGAAASYAHPGMSALRQQTADVMDGAGARASWLPRLDGGDWDSAIVSARTLGFAGASTYRQVRALAAAIGRDIVVLSWCPGGPAAVFPCAVPWTAPIPSGERGVDGSTDREAKKGELFLAVRSFAALSAWLVGGDAPLLGIGP